MTRGHGANTETCVQWEITVSSGTWMNIISSTGKNRANNSNKRKTEIHKNTNLTKNMKLNKVKVSVVNNSEQTLNIVTTNAQMLQI